MQNAFETPRVFYVSFAKTQIIKSTLSPIKQKTDLLKKEQIHKITQNKKAVKPSKRQLDSLREKNSHGSHFPCVFCLCSHLKNTAFCGTYIKKTHASVHAFDHINTPAAHLDQGTIPLDFVGNRPLTGSLKRLFFQGIFTSVKRYSLYPFVGGYE